MHDFKLGTLTPIMVVPEVLFFLEEAGKLKVLIYFQEKKS